jgi:hypothetical protein
MEFHHAMEVVSRAERPSSAASEFYTAWEGTAKIKEAGPLLQHSDPAPSMAPPPRCVGLVKPPEASKQVLRNQHEMKLKGCVSHTIDPEGSRKKIEKKESQGNKSKGGDEEIGLYTRARLEMLVKSQQQTIEAQVTFGSGSSLGFVSLHYVSNTSSGPSQKPEPMPYPFPPHLHLLLVVENQRSE